MASTEASGRTPPSPGHHLIAGTLGGIVSTAGLYPLELVKTRMQVVEVAKVGGAAVTAGGAAAPAPTPGPYSSVSSALRVVIQREGWRGLYLGLTPATIASAGSWGGYFYFYEHAKERKLRYARQSLDNSKQQLQTHDHLAAGVEAGAILVILFNPLWLVKTRLALQGADARHIDPLALPSSGTQQSRKYAGMYDALRTIVREEGVAGLYRGVMPALFLTSHGAIQFAVYEWLKKMATTSLNVGDIGNSCDGGSRNPQPPAWISVFNGGTAKIIASTVTYPYQVIKSRLQQREATVPSSIGPPGRLRRYRGMIDCIVKIWRIEGPRGYFRGVLPNALKVAPSAALTFVVYEEVLKLDLSVATR